MLQQVEGSRAVASAVAACRPQVICAYPISPQTHVVEELSRMVKAGELVGCEYINVESEFAAMSGAIGASAVGARSYTATSSQGLLYMVEAIFRIAEELSVPVMVCMDGFVLTHATERVDVPERGPVDSFLPRFAPRQVLDPDRPVSIGAMVGPEAFTEVRYLAHMRQLDALEVIPRVAAEFADVFGRDSGGLVRPYRGVAVGLLGITSFRPFPADAIRAALAGATRVVVIDRALAVGLGGVVAGDVQIALNGTGVAVRSVIAGLGGRPITAASLRTMIERAVGDGLPALSFLDLDHALVDHELELVHLGDRDRAVVGQRAERP
ncbi:hypothetical protein [Pengzhenrongella sp.]|jgi:pyruvate ferredoxin oxidoreductase alpha subunit|uniref:hypothetical protein n=1 Tax=Pengzhenrongella sp. TaxID=2888820 RepID=UPI002F9207FE